MDATVLAAEAVPKAACYVSLAVAIGVIVARWLLGRAAADAVDANGRLSALAALAAAALLLSTLLRLIGHTVAVFGPADAWAWESVQLIAVESRWGGAWQIQFFAAALLFAAAMAVRFRGGRGWRATALAALICCAATPLLGHAAGSLWRGLLHGAHLLAGGAWLGTLIAIVLFDWLGRRDSAPMASLDERGPAESLTAGMVHRFSPIALAAASVVFITGLLAGVLYLTTAADLLQTSYGRALTIKLALVLAILVCGYANWQRARAREAPWMPLLRTEAALALLVLVVTSVLTELEHP